MSVVKRRRSTFEIIYNILKLCTAPQNFTAIMYKANLSFFMAKEYLADLKRKQFVEHYNKRYLLTPLGNRFVEAWEDLLMLWEEREICLSPCLP